MLSAIGVSGVKETLASNLIRTFGYSGNNGATPYVVPDGCFARVHGSLNTVSTCAIDGAVAAGSTSTPFTLRAGQSFLPSTSANMYYYTIEEYTV
jgi:hypothetical protein